MAGVFRTEPSIALGEVKMQRRIFKMIDCENSNDRSERPRWDDTTLETGKATPDTAPSLVDLGLSSDKQFSRGSSSCGVLAFSAPRH